MSDDKVVHINPELKPPSKRPEPDPEVVAMLEKILARAKRGEVTSFAACFLTCDNGVANCYKTGEPDSFTTLIGAASGLVHRLNSDFARED